MSETFLHTEHFTAKERAMSTAWHNPVAPAQRTQLQHCPAPGLDSGL